MLKAFFQWLDAHPGSYWLPATLATLLLAIQIAFALRQKERGPTTSALGSARDALALFLFIFAWRWPFLLAANAFNPDESQLIAGSITLAHDPVFWRSVDGTTSGPFNFYLLVPLSWLGFSPDYFIARLTGLLLVTGALFIIHRALAGLFGRAVAWLAVLPAAGFFATVTHPDFVHYSSEHLTLFLVAVSIWLLAARNPAISRLSLASFIAGAMVWAKLQALPLSAGLVCCGMWLAARETGLPAKLRWRRAAAVGVVALLPTLLVLSFTAATGQTDDLVRRYLFQNLFYVGNAQPIGTAIRGMSALAASDGQLHVLLASAGMILLGSGIYFSVRRLRPPALFVAGGFLTVAAMAAVLAPRREFLHYALLFPVPLTFWLGTGLGEWWPKRAFQSLRWATGGVVFLVVGFTAVITRCFQPVPEMYGRFAYHWSHPRTNTAMLTRALAGQKDCIAVWGWAADLYVETGLTQATRDTHTTWSIVATEQLNYYRDCYLADVRRNQPVVFIDAAGPGAFGFNDRSIHSHEIFPALANYIRENYTLVADFDHARVYARNGLRALHEITPARILALKIQGRINDTDRVEITPTPLAGIDQLERKTIAQREVLMIPPPTQLEWALDENVREVSLEFGFDPAADEQGRRSHGAGIFLELANDYGSQTLFHRFLDPVNQPAHRTPQTVLVILPAFLPGTRLILRSDSGPYDDRAWDLIYLAGLRFKLGPPARR